MTLEQLSKNLNEYLKNFPNQANLPLYTWKSYENRGFYCSSENLINHFYLISFDDKMILQVEAD